MKKKINENMGGIMVTYVSPTKGKNQLLVKSVEEANMAIPEDATYFDITKGDNSSEEKNLVSWGGKGGYWDNASNPDFNFGGKRKSSEINNILNKKDNMKINESQLRKIVYDTIKESIEKNPELQESFFSRIGAGWDAAKNKMMGLGDSVSSAYKEEKALDLYKAYRDALSKANKMMPNAKKKATNAFGSYASARDFNNGVPAAQPAVNENVEESFIGGTTNVAKNIGNNIWNKGLKNTFSGTKQAYAQGDAASDVASHSQAFAAANKAKASFINYCKQNAIDPQKIVNMYNIEVRQGVISGNDMSKQGERIARKQGSFAGTGALGNELRNRKVARDAQAAPAFGRKTVTESELRNMISNTISEILKK